MVMFKVKEAMLDKFVKRHVPMPDVVVVRMPEGEGKRLLYHMVWCIMVPHCITLLIKTFISANIF